MDLWNIRCNFNNSVDWHGTLRLITTAVPEYNNAVIEEQEYPGTHQNLGGYINYCLPQYWQAVRAHNIHRFGGVDCLPSNSHYDVGIFLVGYSSIPIVLSIAEIQPCKEIYFICSNDTLKKCNEITNRLAEMLKDPPGPFHSLISPRDANLLIERVEDAKSRAIAISDPSDPVSTFREIKTIIDNVDANLGKKAKIALDLTGGKKTMIGGGFTAGSIYSVSPKCDMFYVDSSDYDPALGAPTPGTEFLSQLKNPYDVYNLQSIQQAEILFAKHNYEAAAELWGSVCEKLEGSTGTTGESYAEQYTLEEELKTVEKRRDMANCYHLWDAFDYKQAIQNKGEYRAECNDKHIHRRNSPTDNIDVLQILSEMTTREGLFTSGDSEKRVIHYVVDRYQNGMRRKQTGEFVDAIVRFTQVVELLCIYKMYQLQTSGHLIFHEPPPDIVPLCDLNDEGWRISSLIKFLFGRYDTYRADKHDWTLEEGCARLRPRDYGPFTQAEDIVDLISSRHDFIHVNSSMRQAKNKKHSEKLRELARKFLEDLSQGYSLEFDKLLQLHEFRQLE